MDEQKNRSQEIIRTSIIGIAANVLLAAFKAVVGILASSVAIVLYDLPVLGVAAQETFQTSDTTINGLDEIQFK